MRRSAPPTGTDPSGSAAPACSAANLTSAVERLSAIPGGGPDSMHAVLGEVGLYMSVFGTPQRLCSWAKVGPRTVQSGRNASHGHTGNGNRYLKAALGQIATGAAKTDTFLGTATDG